MGSRRRSVVSGSAHAWDGKGWRHVAQVSGGGGVGALDGAVVSTAWAVGWGSLCFDLKAHFLYYL